VTSVRTNKFLAIDEQGRLSGTERVLVLPVDQGFEHGLPEVSHPIPLLTIRATTSISPLESGCSA